jgi:hypothetical protein
MLRFVSSVLTFVAAAVMWVSTVTAIGVWWMAHHPPTLPPGSDTYFMTSSWIYRLTIFIPLLVFAAWCWRRSVVAPPERVGSPSSL